MQHPEDRGHAAKDGIRSDWLAQGYTANLGDGLATGKDDGKDAAKHQIGGQGNQCQAERVDDPAPDPARSKAQTLSQNGHEQSANDAPDTSQTNDQPDRGITQL